MFSLALPFRVDFHSATQISVFGSKQLSFCNLDNFLKIFHF